MNDEGKKISNVQIAKLVAARGHDFDKVLENLDAGRSPEQEEEKITEAELNEMVDNICAGWEESEEQEEWYKEQRQAELEAYEASYNSKVHKSR